jgi:hypothetical protein
MAHVRDKIAPWGKVEALEDTRIGFEPREDQSSSATDLAVGGKEGSSPPTTPMNFIEKREGRRGLLLGLGVL